MLVFIGRSLRSLVFGRLEGHSLPVEFTGGMQLHSTAGAPRSCLGGEIGGRTTGGCKGYSTGTAQLHFSLTSEFGITRGCRRFRRGFDAPK